jgi:anthranilate/para-aminobenzoate synthase component II
MSCLIEQVVNSLLGCLVEAAVGVVHGYLKGIRRQKAKVLSSIRKCKQVQWQEV